MTGTLLSNGLTLYSFELVLFYRSQDGYRSCQDIHAIAYRSTFCVRKRRYLGRYFAHPMMQNRRAKRDDYKPSAVRVTQRCVP
ncbi:hypothetical protein [Piscirickettsia salmonis]|uniref:hypothetical protein n=1 Tax=Piscirickettsia salmonis TaxID=1238 RepID=UPI001E3C467C|nr:hypothetical protein [Piscirickettsia salmonis]